ncbi:hypothetical protein [Deinococcus aerophilus]|uniref:hypothetical protein n=1 Tax=Deinococcus aerophilus TaxID=522488 RepID=UPI00166AF1AC|nr:hypothetical protein [Deinococcus aerophilus]
MKTPSVADALYLAFCPLISPGCLALSAAARALNLSVAAEGIENLAQWPAMTELGCGRSPGSRVGHPQNVYKTLDLLT